MCQKKVEITIKDIKQQVEFLKSKVYSFMDEFEIENIENVKQEFEVNKANKEVHEANRKLYESYIRMQKQYNKCFEYFAGSKILRLTFK